MYILILDSFLAPFGKSSGLPFQKVYKLSRDERTYHTGISLVLSCFFIVVQLTFLEKQNNKRTTRKATCKPYC